MPKINYRDPNSLPPVMRSAYLALRDTFRYVRALDNWNPILVNAFVVGMCRSSMEDLLGKEEAIKKDLTWRKNIGWTDDHTVWGFYEEEIPIFVQGNEPLSELHEIVTADTCNAMIEMMRKLKARVAEFELSLKCAVGAAKNWRRSAEVAEALDIELAKVLSVLRDQWCSEHCPIDTNAIALGHLEVCKAAEIVLTTTPAEALERAKAKDKVVTWAREIAVAGDVVWPEALNELDALSQEESKP